MDPAANRFGLPEFKRSHSKVLAHEQGPTNPDRTQYDRVGRKTSHSPIPGLRPELPLSCRCRRMKNSPFCPWKQRKSPHVVEHGPAAFSERFSHRRPGRLQKIVTGSIFTGKLPAAGVIV